ncbi:MAG: hypothetical protein H6703_12725 [Myxococcales bacterium]|nr:hypothetical protein [Myxococcales bacterium]
MALVLCMAGCTRPTPDSVPEASKDALMTRRPTRPAPDDGMRNEKLPTSIGSARMEPDGTLVLTLRAEDGAGTIGDAQFRYGKDHPQYQEVLDHLGGLTPGEEKPVPPWD